MSSGVGVLYRTFRQFDSLERVPDVGQLGCRALSLAMAYFGDLSLDFGIPDDPQSGRDDLAGTLGKELSEHLGRRDLLVPPLIGRGRQVLGIVVIDQTQQESCASILGILRAVKVIVSMDVTSN